MHGYQLQTHLILKAAYQSLKGGTVEWIDILKVSHTENINPSRWVMRLPQWWNYIDSLKGVDLEASLAEFNEIVYVQVFFFFFELPLNWRE